MPIGTQKFGDIEITEEQLRQKYDFIIKEAVLKADPTLEVIRADDELDPSCISNNIFTKLMHSKFVIADITYPNPNVFYELGLRHAIKTGTILIREKIDLNIPFDISHLRHIEYTQEPAGMNKLSEQLKKRFNYYALNASKPDNQFLELCNFTNYEPITYAKPQNNDSAVTNTLLSLLFKCPEILATLVNPNLSEVEKQQLALTEVAKNPDIFEPMLKTMVTAGMLKFQ
jgi:hypothetical protein